MYPGAAEVKSLKAKIRKYEKALINLASFGEGSEATSFFDSPGESKIARIALGKKICSSCLKKLKE